jgi:hypothetical protein
LFSTAGHEYPGRSFRNAVAFSLGPPRQQAIDKGTSPLANGVLSGKYSRADLNAGTQQGVEGSRKAVAAVHGSLSERALAIADVVASIASETGHRPAQIALAWTLLNPGVTATLLGARTEQQLEDNLGALNVSLSEGHVARLEQASAIELGFRHDMLRRPLTVQLLAGGLAMPQRNW